MHSHGHPTVCHGERKWALLGDALRPDPALVSGMPYVGTGECRSLPDVAGCKPHPTPDTARSCRYFFFAITCNALVESGTSDGHATLAGYFPDELCGKKKKNRDHKQRKGCALWILIHQPSIQEAGIQPTELLFRSAIPLWQIIQRVHILSVSYSPMAVDALSQPSRHWPLHAPSYAHTYRRR